MEIGGKLFDTQNDCFIMGILNVTPDSFSDGGRYTEVEAAVERAGEMIRQGATIIDIGGESTRPGFEMITAKKEIARVLPTLKAIKDKYDIPVSVDTYKSEVARAVIEAGADMINDEWGLKYDDQMAGVIAEGKVACCLMHNRKNATYQDFDKELLIDLAQSVKLARNAGIEDAKIILDPGIGFAKSQEQNLTAIKSCARIKKLGFPVLLGCSRKSVIGNVLELPKDERVEGTLVTSVYGVIQGVSFLRVHDIKENYRAMRMTQALCGRV